MKTTYNFVAKYDDEVFYLNMGYDHVTEHEVIPNELIFKLGRRDTYIEPYKIFGFTLFNKEKYYSKYDIQKYKCHNPEIYFFADPNKRSKLNIITTKKEYGDHFKIAKSWFENSKGDFFVQWDEKDFYIITDDKKFVNKFKELIEKDDLYFYRSSNGPLFLNQREIKDILSYV